MSGVITINGRSVGRKKPLFADWSMPYPPDLRDDGGRLTLRDLIARTVRAEAERFRRRQDDLRFLQALTARQIDEAAPRGKIDMGGHEIRQAVDDEAAVAAALQAFEDGLYLVVLDDVQLRDLDAQIHLQPDSRVTFVRLVMLAGG